MDARITEAEAHFKAGRRDEGAAALLAVLAQDPAQSEETYLRLGRALYLAGRAPEALRWTQEAVARHPDAFALWNLHGVMLRTLRRPVEALAALERAMALAPDEVGPKVNRGSVLMDLGRAAEGRTAFAEVLADDPQNPTHLLNLSRAEGLLGERASAEAHVRQALAVRPDFIEAWLQLAHLAAPEAAEAILDGALAVKPDDPRLLEAMAMTLRAAGDTGRARAFLEDLTARDPDLAWAHFHLGDLLSGADDPAGLVHLRRALALAPDVLDHRLAMIQGLERASGPGEGARLDEAVALAQALPAGLHLKPSYSKVLRDLYSRLCDHDRLAALGDFADLGRAWAKAGLHTALLRQMPRVASLDDRLELMAQHRLWGEAVEARAAAQPLRRTARPSGSGKIRLGFMSSDLRRHVVSFFALPLFEHIDPRFEVYGYSFYQGRQDALQAEIAGRLTEFRWRPGIGAREAAQMIADDGLDMLIELGGSTQMNKLEVMAWRPAPVQASWLGYPHSAGLSAIDHFLCDPQTAPADPRLLTERPLVLPRSWIALGAPVFDGFPTPAEGLPETRAGAITFGTANAPYKYSPQTLATWARITARVPGARFAFIRPEAGSATFRANVERAFAAEGVTADRLVYRPVRGDHLRVYDEVDISLDAFPLTGGTTTTESLWMGVPVVSLRGPAVFERLSAAILTHACVGDLVADDLAGFEAIALSLAADRPRRAALRAGLRDMIRQGPMGQPRAFAADFYQTVAQALGRA